MTYTNADDRRALDRLAADLNDLDVAELSRANAAISAVSSSQSSTPAHEAQGVGPKATDGRVRDSIRHGGIFRRWFADSLKPGALGEPLDPEPFDEATGPMPGDARAIRADMARLGATPATYAAKKLREAFSPKREPKREPMTIILDDISVNAVAEWEWEYDDDGCGGPGTTGNSMTGYRGRYKSVTGLRFAGTAEEALKILNDALESCVDEAQDKIDE